MCGSFHSDNEQSYEEYCAIRNKCKISNRLEKLVMPTLEEITKKQEYKTAYLLISTLANMCAADESKIIELLTGYLWDEEEAGHIKRSA